MAKAPAKTAPEATAPEPAAEEKKATKSIVNARYVGKYKKGGNDDLAVFINEQCTDEKTHVFDWAKFFDLCRANGLGEKEGVDHYQEQVLVEKRNGAAGRARMTLRNRLAAIVRRDKRLKGLDGDLFDINLPALPKVGVAKEAA